MVKRLDTSHLVGKHTRSDLRFRILDLSAGASRAHAAFFLETVSFMTLQIPRVLPS